MGSFEGWRRSPRARFPKLHIEPFEQFEGSRPFTNFIKPLLQKTNWTTLGHHYLCWLLNTLDFPKFDFHAYCLLNRLMHHDTPTVHIVPVVWRAWQAAAQHVVCLSASLFVDLSHSCMCTFEPCGLCRGGLTKHGRVQPCWTHSPFIRAPSEQHQSNAWLTHAVSDHTLF